RELVELHGGTVRASSAGPGQGASFVLEFPTVDSPELRQNHVNATGLAGASPSLDGVHVLLVDDEEDARTLLATVLEDRGARVTTVSSCEEALSLLRTRPEEPPQVIVSDIGMVR